MIFEAMEDALVSCGVPWENCIGPQTVWDKAKVEEDGDKHYRVDVLWQYFSTLKSGDGRQRFKRLSKIAMLVLTIPHSNADEERVFSMVRKNKTPFCPSLGLE